MRALYGITGGSSDQDQEIFNNGALPIIIKLLNSELVKGVRIHF